MKLVVKEINNNSSKDNNNTNQYDPFTGFAVHEAKINEELCKRKANLFSCLKKILLNFMYS